MLTLKLERSVYIQNQKVNIFLIKIYLVLKFSKLKSQLLKFHTFIDFNISQTSDFSFKLR